MVRPYRFDFNIDTLPTADPSKYISWSTMPINNYMCDSVTIMFSVDRGKYFYFVERLSYYTGKYTWNIPNKSS